MDLSSAYCGEKDLALFGVKLKYHQQPRELEKTSDFVVYFGNPKNDCFATDVKKMIELQELGVRTLVVVQNAWEGNVGQLLRKNELGEAFGIVFDQNNIFKIVEEIVKKPQKSYVFYYEGVSTLNGYNKSL